jgi:hypothetical protein
MALISEIADVIKMLGEVVKNTREIVKAVNDGREFLASRHPEAQKDFSDLLTQMQLTVEGLAEVTKVISAFRFVSDGTVDRDTADRELARFNDYIVKQTGDIAKLRGRIRELKADCEKVRELRDKLDARTETASWGTMFGLLGDKARQRTQELHSSVSNFYADDQRMIDLFKETLELAESAIKDVETALGPPGIANPYNVPKAAAILGAYAVLFDEPHKELDSLADVLNDARIALRP